MYLCTLCSRCHQEGMPAPGKMQWMLQKGELPSFSFPLRDPGLVLTLQLSPLLLSFTLRKAECCPFNLTHRILEEGSQELKAGKCGSKGSGLAETHRKAPVLERLSCT